MPTDHSCLIRKLESRAALSEADKAAIEALPISVRRYPADVDVVHEQRRNRDCSILLEGLACRYRVYQGGQRQIMSFQTAGDILDLDGLLVPATDHSVASLTPVRVGSIPVECMRTLLQVSSLRDAIWRDSLIDAAVFREWLGRACRKTARERVAHLICEFLVRLNAVGLADGFQCDFSITQAEVADALGLSTVHVNRVLQELRAEGLFTLRGKRLTVRDWGALCIAGDFDCRYLHFASPALTALQTA